MNQLKVARRRKTLLNSESHLSTSRTNSTPTPPSASSEEGGAGQKPNTIPPQALEHLRRELRSFNDSLLEASVRGRFCYVSYSGGPLCRLGYRGELEEWDFAIYKYSTQRYGELELAPTYDTVRECIDRALHACDFR